VDRVERFGVSIPPDLLAKFDKRIRLAGYPSRSEAIRDVIRDYLVRQQWEQPQGDVVGTVTLVYDHHVRQLEDHITELQHQHTDIVCCTTHVHIDHDNCIEVVVVHGSAAQVREVAEALIAMRGVKHGQLVCTTTGADV